MKTVFLSSLFLVTFIISTAQVGIGTNNPKSLLDIKSSSQTIPSNEDGILIPKIDDFPLVNPTLDQDGMMVFVTGLGVPTKGFYYWDHNMTSWSLISGGADDLGNHTATTTLDMDSNVISDVQTISTLSTASYDKLRVWGNDRYTIGMNNAMTFGYLNDFATTFTMNSDNDRGWVWRDENDAKSDGAASLTTDGRFSVKSILHSQGTLLVDGNTTLSSLAGVGNRMVVADAMGVLTSQVIPTGTASTVNNGLNISGSDIHLGGTLIEDTNITQGNNQMNFDLNGTGDLNIESNANNNMFHVDAINDRIGIGTATPQQTLQVNGEARINTRLIVGGANNAGNHEIMIASNDVPAMKIGNRGFNNAESGRITFDEFANNHPNTGTYCGFEWRLNGSNNKFQMATACTGEDVRMTFERDGEIGIATENPTAALSVNGTVNKPGGGDWAVFSDRRLKKDISDYNEGLDLIMKVHPVNFTYNQKYFSLFGEGEKGLDKKMFQGVIAQELQEVSPDMVTVVNTSEGNSSDVDGGSPTPKGGEFLQVDSSKFTYALINSVQQQQQQIEAQQKEIDELKIMVQKLLNKK